MVRYVPAGRQVCAAFVARCSTRCMYVYVWHQVVKSVATVWRQVVVAPGGCDGVAVWRQVLRQVVRSVATVWRQVVVWRQVWRCGGAPGAATL